ncbi:MAG: CDP-alcohol phosphatidyltransferase family protein [Pseudooceanicola sp.]
MSNKSSQGPIALWRAYLRSDKAKEELRGNWVMALAYRAPGVVVSALCLRLGIRANTVTMTGALMALSLPVVAVVLPPVAAAWAVCLLGVCAIVLDCVDGDIARSTATASPFGARLDFLVDMALWGLLYGAIGIVADRLHDGGWGWTALAIAAAWARVLARLYNDHAGGAATTQFHPWTPVRVAEAFVAGLSGAIPLLAVAVIAAPWTVWLLVAYSAADLIDATRRLLRAPAP